MTPQHLHRILATLLVSVAATLGLSAAEPFDSFSFLDGPDTSTALPTVCPVDSMASGPVTIEAPDSLPRRRNGKIVIADIDPEILNRRVIVGRDTVNFIIPQRNYGRYDRGLFNFLFIPRGQWQFGLTASYGQLSTEDVQILSVLNNLNLKGTLYTLKPTVSYFFGHNQSIGLRFTYSRGELDLTGLSVDIDDDMSFSLSGVSYYSNSYTGSVFYRNYVGLSEQKRFAVFNEVELGVGSGASRFKRLYNGEPRDTRTMTTKLGLNFSPGVCVFIMDNVCFNVSFGVFGLHITHERQVTDGVEEGSRTSSGANFRFNLFNINFGLGVNI
ncbi:MAG: hypothetical protein HDS56_04260 [Barnesiella sp.]|nr:hypothetical protein [Bacteroidales bacterium]MBD5250375.1 hypothetical protein [Barnesiella sp.]MBD5254234.1 hypothetical protein [Barnesiella sp.]